MDAWTKWYKLDENNQPIPCENHSEYFAWHQTIPKEKATGIGLQLAKTQVTEDVSVSTVFLGTNHTYDCGPPELWETMVFGGEQDESCYRYRSHDDAIQGHHRIVEQVRFPTFGDAMKRRNDGEV